jgi:hypothetical protein
MRGIVKNGLAKWIIGAWLAMVDGVMYTLELMHEIQLSVHEQQETYDDDWCFCASRESGGCSLCGG